MSHRQWMFWWHVWVARAVYPRYEPVFKPDNFSAFNDVAVPKTDVLYVCACGHAKSIALHGTWKLTDIQPGQSSENKGEQQ